jgi:hypothetical protein
MDKKEQLGMNPSTAKHRLQVDLLFAFAVQLGHVCFRCGQPLDRDTFSIDHKESWLKAANPRATYFDLQNIAFSHHWCNSFAPVQLKKHPTTMTRIEARRAAQRAYKRRQRGT